MDIDETHQEYEGLYDGIEEYREELIDRTDRILEQLVELEHRCDEIIYNKGWSQTHNVHGTVHSMMLDAEDVPAANVDFGLKLNRIIGDLVNLQKDL